MATDAAQDGRSGSIPWLALVMVGTIGWILMAAGVTDSVFGLPAWIEVASAIGGVVITAHEAYLVGRDA